VSWSVNPQPIIDGEEFRTASIKKRLEMAQILSEKGYKIGLHFDPILFYRNWKSIYIDLVDNIFRYVKPENIIWISLGAFRYIQGLKEIIQERFKSSNIIYSEQVKGNDGKMRYPKPIRMEMFREIYNRIRKHSQDVFVYFCMEDKTVWNKIMGFAPSNNDELGLMFENSIKRRFEL
jgi:spore photoproduct lyase